MSQRVLRRIVGASSAAILALGFGFELSQANADSSHGGKGSGKVYTGDSEGPCEQREKKNKRGATNIVFELHTCNGDNWIPDVASADAESQEIALKTWQGLMKFCIQYPTLGAMQAGGYGPDKPNSEKSHWKTGKYSGKIDGESTEGFIKFASEPAETITVKGATADTPTQGIMANEGWGFPYIGKLMRPHGSHGNPGDDAAMEMIHMYCMPTIEGAMQYNGPSNDELPGPEVLQAALTASETGGIAAVSKGGAASGGAATGAKGATSGAANDVSATGKTSTVKPSTAMPNSRVGQGATGMGNQAATSNSRKGRILFGKSSGTTQSRNSTSAATSNQTVGKQVNNTELNYTGSWAHSSGDSLSVGKFQKDSSHSSIAGDTATYKFNGSSFALVTTLDAHHGMVGVSIDGGREQIVDLYSPTRAFQQTAFQSQSLASGAHTVTLRVLGQANPKSSGKVVTIDRVDIA